MKIGKFLTLSILGLAISLSGNAFAKSKTISMDEAKKIALDHAKLNDKNVTFSKITKEHDDGYLQYEVEFYHNNIEYDYDINAETGEIFGYSHDMYHNSKNTKNHGKLISEAKAMDIAFKHAGISQKDAGKLRVEFDKDHNSAEYDIEFYHKRMEYDYEIDAYTGTIVSFSKD